MSKILTGKNIECGQCGKIFYAPDWEIRRGKKFCSRSCQSVWKSKQVGEKATRWQGGGVASICPICNNKFMVSNSQVRRNRGKFCSKACHIEHQKTLVGDKSNQWKGGYTDLHGYRISVSGQKEHRLVMEKHLGRKLTSQEHIHHINGDKLDNRVENLKIVSNSDHHSKEHIIYHIIDGKKECSTCHRMLLLDEFSKDVGNANGYRYSCKDCHSAYRKGL